jgi:hypothetical protein
MADIDADSVWGSSIAGVTLGPYAFAYDLQAASPKMIDLGDLGDRYTHVSAGSGTIMVGHWSTRDFRGGGAVAWNLAKPATLPGAPTGLSGQAGNRSVKLSWLAPGNLGGRHITGYQVIPYAGGVARPAVTFNSAATNQNVTGLVNGTAYTFTVAAINAAGTGPPTPPSAALTPSAAAA